VVVSYCFWDRFKIQAYDAHSIVLKIAPNLSNLEFPGYTLLVFRRFTFYNAAKMAQVDA
jgi:hypothetical protein